MVRPRIQLEKLNGELSREHYYMHNRSIVTKKVKEMSLLTGSDVLFIGFSPNGQPNIHLGENCNFMEMMRKFCRVSYSDGEKRRHDNIQTLKANYQKEDGYNINVEKLFDAWKVKKIEVMNVELREAITEFRDIKRKQRLLENPEIAISFQKTKEMEENLRKKLDEIRKLKDRIIFEKQKIAAERLIESTMEPFEDYIPEMLSGNDDLLAYANILMCGNEASTSENKQH